MKKNKIPSLVTILILTLITVVMWVSLGIYRALSQKPSPDVPQEIADPLTPTLDIDSLGKIQSRILLNDSEIPEVSIVESPTPVPRATPTALASPTPIPSPTPATSSGTTP